MYHLFPYNESILTAETLSFFFFALMTFNLGRIEMLNMVLKSRLGYLTKDLRH